MYISCMTRKIRILTNKCYTTNYMYRNQNGTIKAVAVAVEKAQEMSKTIKLHIHD